MSANENELLSVDPSERTGGETMEAAPLEEEDELSVDPSEGPAEPPQ